jgi:hypothetical protein
LEQGVQNEEVEQNANDRVKDYNPFVPRYCLSSVQNGVGWGLSGVEGSLTAIHQRGISDLSTVHVVMGVVAMVGGLTEQSELVRVGHHQEDASSSVTESVPNVVFGLNCDILVAKQKFHRFEFLLGRALNKG